MIINTNSGSASAARLLGNATDALQKSLQRLSSGKKNTLLSDDIAGVVVGDKFDAEIKRLSASSANVANLQSYTQTQSGYLDQISDALNRMSELAMLATDATKTTDDRQAYSDEFTSLRSFVIDVGNKQFNGISLFGAGSQAAYLGLNSSGAAVKWDSTAVVTTAINTGMSLAVDDGITSAAAAANALDDIQAAITALASTMSSVGSNLSRLEFERSALAVLKDNIGAARSRIVDVDVAEESANFAKQQILVQSGTAMLAQANILPQSALRLIG